MALLTPTLTLTPDLGTQVADLQARVAKLEAALQISATGDVLLKSDTAIGIQAGTTVTIKSMSSATFQSNGQMTIQSSGSMTLRGSMININ